jgi:peptide/nickel transport system permease protein
MAERDIGGMTQWQLIRRRFSRHRLAVAGACVLLVMHFVAIFAEFFAPYTREWQNLDTLHCPPQIPLISPSEGLHTYAVTRRVDPVTLRNDYGRDSSRTIPLGFFVRGEPYRIWGLFPCRRRFFGVDRAAYRERYGPAAPAPTFYLLGADPYGQDVFSRIVLGSRVSLFVGLLGISITFVLGLTVGGVSGYLGGAIDTIVQRAIEIMNAVPKLPLWIALGAVMPRDWSAVKVYFGITVVLSLLGWPGLARVVRGKILSLREEDYAVAARLLGASHARILFRHLLPGFASHIIVALTLAIPGMILGETALSFLGLGLRPPVVSWGVLLQDCMNLDAVGGYPWMLTPAVFIVVVVLSYNFVGDGLRDAADPYGSVV